METQEIINLLEKSNDEVLNFQQESGTLLMIKTIVSMEKKMKMTQLLNLIQKLLD